jgi:hypothetical protein
MDTGKLLHKELRLDDLILDGARVDSSGTETGFINTMAFLFPPKPDTPSDQPPPGALQRWLKSWAFHVTTIEIRSEDQPDQLRLSFHDQTFTWDKVAVRFIEQDFDPAKPYDLTADGSNFRYAPEGQPDFALGTFFGLGEIGQGRLQIRDGWVGTGPQPQAEQRSATSVSGTIQLKAPGDYSLQFVSDLKAPYLQPLLSRFIPRETDIPKSLLVHGEVRGPYIQPSIAGDVSVHFADRAFFPDHAGCAPQEIHGQYHLSVSGLVLQNLSIEDLSHGGNFQLHFAPAKTISGKLAFELDQEKRWLRTCLLHDSDPSAVFSNLGKSLADSKSELEFSGNLNPLAVEGSLISHISMKDRNAETKLGLSFQLDDEAIHVEAAEHGVTPQIQAPAPAGTKSRTQSSFELALNSNLEADLKYFWKTHRIQLDRFTLLRYPLARVLARFGPFLSDDTFATAAALLNEDSSVDFSLKGALQQSAAESNLDGLLKLSSLNLHGISVESVKIPILVRGSVVSVADAELNLLGGKVLGGLRADFAGPAAADSVQGEFRVQAVDLFRFGRPGTASAEKTDEQAVLDGSVRLNGPVKNVTATADLRLQTVKPNAADPIKLTTINITGNPSGLSLKSVLLDGTGRVDLFYPFTPAAGKQLQLSAAAQELPLDYFFRGQNKPQQGEETPAQPEAAALSGQLLYTGPPAMPLLGSGSIDISKLRIPQLSLEQNSNLRAEIKNGRLQFDSVHFVTHGKELKLVGWVDQRQGWNAQLQGAWDLSTFLTGVQGLEQASGDVILDVSISGPLAGPRVSGPVSVQRASISLPLGRTIVGISDGELNGFFQDDRFDIRSVGARLGGSFVRGSGAVEHLFDPEQRHVLVDFDFNDVTVEPIDHLTLNLNGELSFRMEALQPARLEGDLEIKNALYEDTIKLVELVRALSRTLTGRGLLIEPRSQSSERSKNPLTFDIHVHAADNILFETNFAQAELRGDLRLTGDSNQPLLDGKIEAIDGVFGMQSNEFELISGQLNFSKQQKSLDPDISLIGETTATTRTGEEHHVQIIISGPLSKPNVNFRSDGGLRQEEIQALFGLGTNIEAFDFLQAGKRTRSVAELINPVSGVSIEDRLAGLTKFSTVQIDTALSPTTGEFVPRVVAKRPLTQNVDLDIQNELSGDQVSSMNIDYPLTPYLSLIAGWRSRPATDNVDKTSGTFIAGVHYRTTFPGFKLISPSLSQSQEDAE